MFNRICLLLIVTSLASSKALAQEAVLSSVVVARTPWSSLSYQVPGTAGQADYSQQSVFKSTGWRTAIFAVGGGVLAAAITSATTDEPGFKSAEATALVAGAATGAIFGLFIWPKLFGKSQVAPAT